jgi:hypothetical protein
MPRAQTPRLWEASRACSKAFADLVPKSHGTGHDRGQRIVLILVNSYDVGASEKKCQDLAAEGQTLRAAVTSM